MFPTACLGFSCTHLSPCSRAGAGSALLSALGAGQVTLQRGLGGLPTPQLGLIKDEFQITCNTTGVYVAEKICD